MVIGGGTFPEEDTEELIGKGYAKALFTPGARTVDIVRWIRGIMLGSAVQKQA